MSCVDHGVKHPLHTRRAKLPVSNGVDARCPPYSSGLPPIHHYLLGNREKRSRVERLDNQVDHLAPTGYLQVATERQAFMAVITAPRTPTHELPGAKFTSLCTPQRGASETSVWLVELVPGTPPTPHQVTREEVFVVLAGTARVNLAGTESTAQTGDAIVVPANTSFEISAAGTAPVRAICCLPVGGQARLPGGQTFTPPWAE